jgi:hypothetical protein
MDRHLIEGVFSMKATAWYAALCEFRGCRALWNLTAVLSILVLTTAAQAETVTIKENVKDFGTFSQLNSKVKGGDALQQNSCVPTAVANGLQFLVNTDNGVNGIGNLVSGYDTVNALQKAMNTTAKGTGYGSAATGLVNYIAAKGLAGTVVIVGGQVMSGIPITAPPHGGHGNGGHGNGGHGNGGHGNGGNGNGGNGNHPTNPGPGNHKPAYAPAKAPAPPAKDAAPNVPNNQNIANKTAPDPMQLYNWLKAGDAVEITIAWLNGGAHELTLYGISYNSDNGTGTLNFLDPYGASGNAVDIEKATFEMINKVMYVNGGYLQGAGNDGKAANNPNGSTAGWIVADLAEAVKPAAATPEPSSLVLMLLALMVVPLRAGRRFVARGLQGA